MKENITKLYDKVWENKEYLAAFVLIVCLIIAFYYYWYMPNYGIQRNISSEEQKSTVKQDKEINDIKNQFKSYNLMAIVNSTSEKSIDRLNSLKEFSDSIQVIDIHDERGMDIAKQMNYDEKEDGELDDVLLISDFGYAIKLNGMDAEQVAKAFQHGRKLKKEKENENEKITPENIKSLKEIDTIILTAETCGHCISAKNYINKNSLGDEIIQIPSESEEGQKLTKEFGTTGYPTYISLKTKKVQIGTPFDLNKISRKEFIEEMIKRLTL